MTTVVLVTAALGSELLFHFMIGILPCGEPWQSIVEMFVMLTVFSSLFYFVVMPKRVVDETLKEKEESHQKMMAAILEASADGIVLVDKDLQVVTYNRAYLKIWGDDCAFFVNRDAYQIFECIKEHLEDPELFREQSLVAYTQMENSSVDIIRFKDGRVYERHSFPYIINGEIAGKVSSYRDITEKINLASKQKEIQAKLIQANKMTSLGLLVSGIAHEVNNPNNYIMISSELLYRAWKDCLPILDDYYLENGDFSVGGVPYSGFKQDAADLISGITEGSRRIRDIVNSLKEYSRGSRGNFDQLVDINKVITVSTRMIEHHIKRLTHNFRIELQDHLPQILGNHHQLEQVVINLTLNAAQSLPGSDASVLVRSGYDDEAGEVFVEVIDQGCGIKADYATQIMEPFFTTRLDSGGTGLGLSICQTIVKEHNGKISFSSEPGVGSTFTINFPIAPDYMGDSHK